MRHLVSFIVLCDFTVFYNSGMHLFFKEKKKSVPSNRKSLHILHLENS